VDTRRGSGHLKLEHRGVAGRVNVVTDELGADDPV
jgi:hypothetical protein